MRLERSGEYGGSISESCSYLCLRANLELMDNILLTIAGIATVHIAWQSHYLCYFAHFSKWSFHTFSSLLTLCSSLASPFIEKTPFNPMEMLILLHTNFHPVLHLLFVPPSDLRRCVSAPPAGLPLPLLGSGSHFLLLSQHWVSPNSTQTCFRTSL